VRLLFHYYNTDGKSRLSGFSEWRWLTGILFVLTAIFSVGFHHPDELYQVMEYMNVYAGKQDVSTLSQLEWQYKMRPWFQPIVFHWLTTPLEWVGLGSPFAKSMFLRILTGLFAVYTFSLWALYLFSTREGEQDKELTFEMTLWWFIPYFAVRTSSDTIGALFSLCALAFIFLDFKMRKRIDLESFLAFCFFSGFAFLFRYQTLIITAPALLWMLFIAKIDLKKFFGGIFFIALIGQLEWVFNFMGYGEWVCSTWNHAYSNVILKVSHTFGTLPFWGYFQLVPKRGLYLFSILFILTYLYLWIKKPKHLLTWVTLPYFIIFSFIGHKEVRFLTPLVFLAPIILSLCFLNIKECFGKGAKAFEGSIYILLFINLLVFPFSNFKPANRYLGLYEAVYDNKKADEKLHVFYDGFDQTRSHLKFELNFYKPHPFQVIPITSLASPPKSFLLATSKYSEMELIKKSDKCSIIYQSYPDFVLRLMPEKIRNRSSVLTLTRCQKPKR
jgi:phosphatidylinositol glycan class B